MHSQRDSVEESFHWAEREKNTLATKATDWPYGRRALRRSKRLSHCAWSGCRQGKAQRWPLLHGFRSGGLSSTGRFQARHGPAVARAEELAESSGTKSDLRPRREELCKDGKAPERRSSTWNSGSRIIKTSCNRVRSSIITLIHHTSKSAAHQKYPELPSQLRRKN